MRHKMYYRILEQTSRTNDDDGNETVLGVLDLHVICIITTLMCFAFKTLKHRQELRFREILTGKVKISRI